MPHETDEISDETSDERPPPPKRPHWLRMFLGTAPGLEQFLLAAVPSLVVGGLAIGLFQVPTSVAVAITVGVLVVGIVVTRRLFPPAS